MTNSQFIYLVNTVTLCGHKVLVEDNYSEHELKELLSALSALFREADSK